MEGYDAKFQPSLDKRLECPICLLAQREPMQTPCGHRFCSVCILRALRETGPRCPVDNTKITYHQLFKDNFAKREVLSLTVHCSADDDGCKWKGELRNLEIHAQNCPLVTVPCPHLCGHTCHRHTLPPHLPSCPNKPSCCPTCSVHFPRNRLVEHNPYCSKIVVPESVQSCLLKAEEVLKWSGHLKLKLNNQPVQVTAYLSVKSDGPLSTLYTGTWYSSLNIIPLNSSAAKIFWKMLHGPEVQPTFFHFGILSNDQKSITFQKMLKKKFDNLHAAVGLRLKPMNRRDLTLIYFFWSESSKRLMACVAELKSHLVRHIQDKLQSLQHSSRGRRQRAEASGPPRSMAVPPGALHPGMHHHLHPHTRHLIPAAVRHLPHPHVHPSHPHDLPPPHPHIVPSHPPQPANIQVININSVQGQPPHQSNQLNEAGARGNQPAILPSLLSWQMSQSLNTRPWRVQPSGVPFFTFPSTPPQFIPANSYPYTFAPMPAAPFSIAPMQPVSVHSSYNGIPLPHPTVVDSAVPLSSGAVLAGAPTTAFVLPPAQGGPLPRPLTDGDIQAVAINLNGSNSVATVDRDSGTTVAIAMNALPPPQAMDLGLAEPAILPGPGQIVPGYHVSGAAAVMPAQIIVGQSRPLLGHEVVVSHTGEDGLGPSRELVRAEPAQGAAQVASEPGPHDPHYLSYPAESHHHVAGPSMATVAGLYSSSNVGSVLSLSNASSDQSHASPLNISLLESDSVSDSESPSSILASFSPLSSDSEVPSSADLYSPLLPFSSGSSSSSSDSSLSSDDDEGSSSQSDSDASEGSSALHTLARAAALLDNVSDASSSESSPASSSVSEFGHREPTHGPPLLINISDSDVDLHTVSPASVIDLTHSPESNVNSPGVSNVERSRDRRSVGALHVHIPTGDVTRSQHASQGMSMSMEDRPAAEGQRHVNEPGPSGLGMHSYGHAPNPWVLHRRPACRYQPSMDSRANPLSLTQSHPHAHTHLHDASYRPISLPRVPPTLLQAQAFAGHQHTQAAPPHVQVVTVRPPPTQTQQTAGPALVVPGHAPQQQVGLPAHQVPPPAQVLTAQHALAAPPAQVLTAQHALAAPLVQAQAQVVAAQQAMVAPLVAHPSHMVAGQPPMAAPLVPHPAQVVAAQHSLLGPIVAHQAQAVAAQALASHQAQALATQQAQALASQQAQQQVQVLESQHQQGQPPAPEAQLLQADFDQGPPAIVGWQFNTIDAGRSRVDPSAMPHPYSHPHSHPHAEHPTQSDVGITHVQRPPGSFWDTVLPSLDMSLQNSSNATGPQSSHS